MLFVSTSVTNDCLNSSTNNTTIDVKLIFFIVDSLVIVANSQIQLIKPESDGEVKKNTLHFTVFGWELLSFTCIVPTFSSSLKCSKTNPFNTLPAPYSCTSKLCCSCKLGS